MFENLSSRLNGIIKKLSGQAVLTADNVQEALNEIRKALLVADVALEVVEEFLDSLREKVLGLDVSQNLTPGQELVKQVQAELVQALGDTQVPINLATTPPAVIMLAGLQGSGKTTTAAKLAKYLQEREKKTVLLVSCDVYRPAAIEQLHILSKEVGAEFLITDKKAPVEIATLGLETARHRGLDVVIIDTAGRLHIDETMMQEAAEIAAKVNPIETLFVVDAMMGQDAVKAAKAFHQRLNLTGIILTKADGDARGGAALSVKIVTGKPIKFIGVGEKVTGFEVFHPDRIASRILGMGDVLSLIEEVEQNIDKEKAEKLAKKIKKNKGFDLEDFREQIKQMHNMGGINSLLQKLPGVGNLGKLAQGDTATKEFKKITAIIDSMTPKERRFPDRIKASEKRRIARGSGTEVQDINKLLKQFEQMQKMMKKFAKPDMMQKMMRGMGGMGGSPFGGGGFPR